MTENQAIRNNKKPPLHTLIVAGMGYFIDAAELILAALLRPASLTFLAIATTDAQIKQKGFELEITQSLGLLLGGIIWGVYGDKKGRKKGMQITIALFSIAAILNGLITKEWIFKEEFYHLFRFLSGFGLAGEFGLGSVLVLEATKKENKNLGPTIITALGMLGIITAALLVQFSILPWNYLFILFGILGFVLLFFRNRQIKESDLLIDIQKQNSISKTNNNSKTLETIKPVLVEKIKTGAFISLFTKWVNFKKLLVCFFIAIPSYYAVGLLVKFSKDLGADLGTLGKVSVPISMIMFYLALGVSDIVANYLSSILKTRKWIFFTLNILNLILIICFFNFPPKTANSYQYFYMPLFGFSVGYWALLVTYISEVFGTNLRATAACFIPNLIRSSFFVIGIIYLMYSPKEIYGPIAPAYIIGLICSISAIIASLFMTKNTLSKDLNFND